MDYQVLFKQENEDIKERFELSMERIGQMATEQTVPEPYRDYFARTASFITMMGEYLRFIESGDQKKASAEVLREWNQKLYQDILPGHYEESYANPAYAVSKLGEAMASFFRICIRRSGGTLSLSMSGDLRILPF